MAPKRTIRPREILAVVDGEVHMVEGVVRGAVEEGFGPVAGDHVAVVDEDRPDLDEDEEQHVQVFVHGDEEDEEAGVAGVSDVLGDEVEERRG